MRAVIFGVVAASLLVPRVVAQEQCRIEREGVFAGDGEHVRLARPSASPGAAPFAVFQAALAVNTDGAPTSYHPDDFLGERLAINRIDNGIVIRRRDNVRMSTAERQQAFDAWRRAGFVLPANSNLAISWQNVIAATPEGKPCVFQSGQHAGYFGSLTAERNGLSGAAAGECQVNDQLDLRVIPAIVLRGGTANPLSGMGAAKGDLVLAINPAGATVAAIIGDTGDGKRIGEGSVALNMRLLGRAQQPVTFSEAMRLDTGTLQMMVAVLPRTRSFERLRPYSADNIENRVRSWAERNGYGSLGALVAAVRACAAGL